MENFDLNQTSNQIQSQFSTPAINNKISIKPIWQTDAFIVLTLLLFWPVGLFLMWKYAPWRKKAKGLLTFFFLLAALPALFIWSLVFGLKGYSLIDNILNPRIINKSKLYICQPVNTEWGKCKNTKYNFSFEYPVKWDYVDLTSGGIGFSPSAEKVKDNYIISLRSPLDLKTEEEAKKFASGGLESSRQETTINGLYATKDYSAFSGKETVARAIIVDGKTVYQFWSIFDKEKEVFNSDELQAIFDHMANSFIKE